VMMRRGKCGILLNARSMTQSEIMSVALAPRI
jgi:hypothetical protein